MQSFDIDSFSDNCFRDSVQRTERDKTAETSVCKQTRISSAGAVSSGILRICLLRGAFNDLPIPSSFRFHDIVHTLANARESRERKSRKSILRRVRLIFEFHARTIQGNSNLSNKTYGNESCEGTFNDFPRHEHSIEMCNDNFSVHLYIRLRKTSTRVSPVTPELCRVFV